MSYYLFLPLLIVAVCEAGIITDHSHHTHGVYHGYGATSYQNVQLENHDALVVPANYGDPAELHETLAHHHHEHVIPVVEDHNDIDHIVSHSAPYEEFTNAELKSDLLEHVFDHDHYALHL